MQSSRFATIADHLPNYQTKQSIILVEDDPLLRESISEYLVRIGYHVTAVENGLKFYHAVAEHSFTAAIIDLGLPDMDGLQLVDYLRNNTSIRCIILTARSSIEERIAGYDSGADLYFVKPVDCRELGSALSRMIERSCENTNGPKTTGEWHLDRQKATLITPSSAMISLTSREMDFLLCLAESPFESVPRKAILKALDYANDEFSNRALESLIRRLRRKIESCFGSSPILTRHGIGYSFSASLSLS